VNLPAGIDRPLSIPEIVDRSVTLAVRRWRTLTVLVLLEAVPDGIARLFIPMRAAPALFIWIVALVLVGTLLSGAVVITTAAVAVPSVDTALRASARRFGALLAVLLLASGYQGLVVGLIAACAAFATLPFEGAGRLASLVAGGVVALVGLVALLPRATLVATIAFPIVALERVSPWTGLMTAFRRARNAGGRRTWLLGLVLFALALAPGLIFGAAMDKVIELTKIPLLELIEELIGDAMAIGFGMVVSTVVSIEMRVRYEGADLEAAIDHAEASASTVHPNGDPSSAPMSSAPASRRRSRGMGQIWQTQPNTDQIPL